MVGSNLSDNTKDGANAWMGGNITLESSNLKNNGQNGFGIGGGSNGMLYQNNTVSGNNGAGI